ncbi:DUF885 family protein [Gemmatimonas sp.]|uniref:DUF885 family protein n=2 Tax=Gemmatimonas sp. TaxID=1962908 RepID=UPI0035695B68
MRADTPLDQLERVGRAHLDRNVAAMRTECTKFALGKTLQQCMSQMNAHEPAESTPDAARRQLTGLRWFLVDKNIVSIPSSEEVKIGESPPDMRWNFAYISIPGPYEKNMPSTFGHVFVGYAFAEGWAHYTEAMMWDAGLGDGDPKTHIGQLSNALLRNVRFLAAIGLHTEGMTIAQVERLFFEDGYQDMATAKQQAARVTFDPEYLDYTVG